MDHLRQLTKETNEPPSPRAVDLALERARRIARIEGLECTRDDELLALILGRGGDGLSALELARSLVERAGGIARLGRARPGSLTSEPGLGKRGAVKLAAIFELGRRAILDETRPVPHHPLDKDRVVAWARPRLVGLPHEEVWVLCVDAKSVLSAAFQVARGGAHGCALLTRDVLTPVVREGASGFVLVHNHPSGDPTPSREDIELSQNLSRAAQTVAVPLLDHVVVAREGATSLFEQGLL